MDFQQDDFVEYDNNILKGLGKIVGHSKIYSYDGQIQNSWIVELQPAYQVPYHDYKFSHSIFLESDLKLKNFNHNQALRESPDFLHAFKYFVKLGIREDFSEEYAFGYAQGKQDRSPDEGFSEERQTIKTKGYSYHYSLGYSKAYEEHPYIER